MFHEKTKHIDIGLHFISDIIDYGSVDTKKVAIEDNPAYMRTKPIPEIKFKHFLNLVNVEDIEKPRRGVGRTGLVYEDFEPKVEIY